MILFELALVSNFPSITLIITFENKWISDSDVAKFVAVQSEQKTKNDITVRNVEGRNFRSLTVF